MTVHELKRKDIPYRVDLQYFAEETPPVDEPNGNSGEGTPSLDDLLKNPEFKQQYEQRMQGSINDRLKKYEGVDVQKYKQWEKEQEDKANADLTENEKLQKQIQTYQQRESQMTEREKGLEIQTAAISEGLDPKLIGRLVDRSAVTKNDNGEFEGIPEAIQAVKDEFPQLFATEGDGEDDEHEEQQQANSKVKTPKPPAQKGNPSTPKNKKEAGRLRAQARHNKEE